MAQVADEESSVGSQKSFLSAVSSVAQSLGSMRFFLSCMG